MAILLGAIDTPQEVKELLTALQNASPSSHLNQVAAITDEFSISVLKEFKQWRAKKALTLNYIQGSVDTPHEIELFLNMLREKNMLCGPIDTPDEVKAFMKTLEDQGILQHALATPLRTNTIIAAKNPEERPSFKR